MNKLITDRPSEWKDWLMGNIEGMDNEQFINGRKIHSMALIMIPEYVREDDVVIAYYNAGYVDRILMSEYVHVDMMDVYVRENIERYAPNEIVFTADTSNEENHEDGYSENEC